MTAEFRHEHASALLAAEALDALTGRERDALLEHVAGCVECERQLAELRDAAGGLAHAVPVVPLAPLRSARVRARLLARAAADVRTRSGPRVVEIPSRKATLQWQRPRMLAAAAVIALLVVGLGWQTIASRRRAGSLERQVASLTTTRTTLQSQLLNRERQLRHMTGPDVRVIDLAASGVRAPTARMFWDQVAGAWTLYAHNLPRTPPNRAYQLWLITPGQQRLSAGTFRAEASGPTVVSAQFALPRDSLAAIAVTEEPATGVPAPTGPIVLLGQTGAGATR